MTNKQTRKRGRPKMDKQQDKRNKRLPVVQVNEAELNAYRAVSKREGVTFSAWVRNALNKASKT